MRRTAPDRSKYKAMWLFAVYDLPVKTRQDRREYSRFHKALLDQGFSMLQFSVYARYCSGDERSRSYRKHIRAILPPGGEVRVLALTDHQFAGMEVYRAKTKVGGEKRPEQLLLF